MFAVYAQDRDGVYLSLAELVDKIGQKSSQFDLILFDEKNSNSFNVQF